MHSVLPTLMTVTRYQIISECFICVERSDGLRSQHSKDITLSTHCGHVGKKLQDSLYRYTKRTRDHESSFAFLCASKGGGIIPFAVGLELYSLVAEVAAKMVVL
jgi:hypothetical protein